MRRLYIVTYDISHPKRLRRVFRTLKGYGEHLQLSVFRCDLTKSQRLELAARLGSAIEASEDQVLFIDLGPTRGRSHTIDYLGRPSPAGDTPGPKVF